MKYISRKDMGSVPVAHPKFITKYKSSCLHIHAVQVMIVDMYLKNM